MMKPDSGRGPRLRISSSPGILFAAGALLFPAFLMQQDLVVRALEIVLFITLNAFSGRRVRPVQFLVVSAGIVLFNLVIPTGRVLMSVLGLPLTEGALKSGLFKATAMTGLIALSQFSIRSDLRLPGRLGGLIGRSLFYFEKIMGERRRIDRRDIIGSIDRLLLEVQGAAAPGMQAETERSTSTWGGVCALAVIVCVNWGALVLTLVHPRPFWG
jgi:heptaprenyl diphosphate synthase